MLKNRIKIYAIPGWGFDANIFQILETPELEFISLNYFQENAFSIEATAIQFSKLIPNNSIILAWSLGGLLAIKLAFLFPNKVKKLILISTQSRFLSVSIQQGIHITQANQFIKKIKYNFDKQKEYFINLANYPNKNKALKEQLMNFFVKTNIASLKMQLTILLYANLSYEYKSLSTTILHIVNQSDIVMPQNDDNLKSERKAIKVHTIDHAGHAGFLTHPHIYKNVIYEFLHVYQ